MQRLLVSVVLVGLLATPAVADKRRAAVHLKQGAGYYNAGHYDDAIAEFKKSYDLDPKPQTLFNIANAYFKKADYRSAIEFFQKYLDVDADGRFAPQALEFSTLAKKNLAEQELKRKVAEEATRIAAEKEQQRLAAEQEQKNVAAKRDATTARVRNAEAFGRAGAWTSAGDEYRAAAESGGDPTLLVEAGDAYRKQPALDKARDAYRAFLEKVPLGAASDDVRTKLAEVTNQLDNQQAELAARDAEVRAAARTDAQPPGPRAISKLFVQLGVIVPPPGVYGRSSAISETPEDIAVEGLVRGIELGGSYAFAGTHAVVVTATYMELVVLTSSVGLKDGRVGRAGLGYRWITRRDATFRPTFGLHFSGYHLDVEDYEGNEVRLGVEPEVGFIVQWRNRLLAHVFVRPDLVPLLGDGLFLGGLGLGIGAHF
ncbi:MAG: tetratricopeptide repeat protein [Deltaproteobacteria bacterium]|nr:tetratricopeptide repeat protein [Deltaproteobacteria bacterium]